ncbi:hypothetical protein GCT19_40870 [Paraburkholderia sp. CNPSo 3155]|uniref:ATP-binding protein n=1 Tax=Paraburkholderia atlantica TaxID=2654982 RepID=UPI00128BEE7C|nr:ATP-binding protein [Paraburkholderia atlantica]MPW11671.1 hypothetical protein [Paraburkholderia atlantica]
MAATRTRVQRLHADVLQNADRHRAPDMPIIIGLCADETNARVELHKEGEAIAGGLIDKIFECGISGGDEIESDAAPPKRGQGLFVAKTYMAKMGGTTRPRARPARCASY